MTEQKPRFGRPGGVKRVTEAFKKLREQMVSQEVRDMLEESAKREQEERRKRSAAPPKDVEV